MKKIVQPSSRIRVAFCAYLLVGIIVTAFYVFSFGYSFWGTNNGIEGTEIGVLWLDLLDILALLVISIICSLQFKSKTRVWSWLLLSPSYVLVLLLLSNIERLNMNVIYLGLALTGVMMALAALLNRFLIRNVN